MNLRIVVLPAKILADGTHKVRIAISHKGQTRYFVTRFVVPSPDNIVNGQVVGVNNASYINQQLRIRMSKIYAICDKTDDTEYYTCSQLVQYIEDAEASAAPKSFNEVAKKFLLTRNLQPNTLKIYQSAIRHFNKFFGADYILQRLTYADLHRYEQHMKDKCQLSPTTISMMMTHLHVITNFAVRQKLAEFDIHPFADYVAPTPARRDCVITLEQLRKIRDIDLSGERSAQIANVRDVFMLSFYLCGMNLPDIMAQDFHKNYIRYIRKKTETRRRVPMCTEFDIQPEARTILDKLTKDGTFMIGHIRSKNSIERIFQDCFPRLSELCGIEKKLIFYAARKTFAQLANQLFISPSIIEYCIGDTVTQSSKVIGYYIQVTPQMANLSIRYLFDAVASDKTLEELQAEAMKRHW